MSTRTRPADPLRGTGGWTLRPAVTADVETIAELRATVLRPDLERLGRSEDGRQWLEHFYLAPRHQGRGLGSAVLHTVLERTDARGLTVALNVLRGSAARRLYERHGFVVEAEDPVDVFMARPPATR